MTTLEQIKDHNEKTLAAWDKSRVYKSKTQRALAEKYRGGKIITAWDPVSGKCYHMALGRNWMKYNRCPVGGLQEIPIFYCE